ncbi:MAG TPA: hypothetical protein PKD19_01270 [Candidatus Saccharibacteria bacterium]|nr:hypothetical protein [Candidatus Saccharibacteria bacterium]HMR37972.1 hypothetical protein [Candidatus Saccharibacteria bacterium]
MDPNQYQPQPPQNYSIDYLDQIAPSQPKTGPSPLIMIVAIIGGLLAMIIFGFVVFGGGTSNTDKWTALYLRTNTIDSVARKQGPLLKDPSLRGINTKLLLYLSNAHNDIKTAAEQAGMVSTKIAKEVSAKEKAYLSDLETKLEDAKVKAVLDRTYAREMSYQIGVLNSLMQQAYNTAGPKTKQTLEDINTNLAAIAKQLSDFEDAK